MSFDNLIPSPNVLVVWDPLTSLPYSTQWDGVYDMWDGGASIWDAGASVWGDPPTVFLG